MNAFVAIAAISAFIGFAIGWLARAAEVGSIEAGEPMESDGWLK